MKVELSNKELEDIYTGLSGIRTYMLHNISEMEQGKNIREEDKELLKTMKETTERQMLLINKIAKLIEGEEI